MPLLSLESNQELTERQTAALLKDASQQIAQQLGKPERYVMVRYQYNPTLLFAGDSRPLAYLQLKSIALPQDATASLSQHLCQLLERHAQIPADRVYIEFTDVQRALWGWNGGTF